MLKKNKIALRYLVITPKCRCIRNIHFIFIQFFLVLDILIYYPSKTSSRELSKFKKLFWAAKQPYKAPLRIVLREENNLRGED